ncbi:hypothetical protein NFJ02_45g113410 [Pycnococcus provasolii]
MYGVSSPFVSPWNDAKNDAEPGPCPLPQNKGRYLFVECAGGWLTVICGGGGLRVVRRSEGDTRSRRFVRRRGCSATIRRLDVCCMIEEKTSSTEEFCMDEKIRRAMGHPRFPASSAFQNRNVTYRQNYLMKLNFPTIAEIKELLSGGHVHAQEQRERDAAVAANEHARRFAPTRVTNRDHTNLRCAESLRLFFLPRDGNTTHIATTEKTTPTAKSLFGGDAEVCTLRRAVFPPCARLWEANAGAVLTTSTSKNTYWWKAQPAREVSSSAQPARTDRTRLLLLRRRGFVLRLVGPAASCGSEEAEATPTALRVRPLS